MSEKEKLIAIARLIVDTCTLGEIEMLCVGLLDARLKLRAMVRKEGVKD